MKDHKTSLYNSRDRRHSDSARDSEIESLVRIAKGIESMRKIIIWGT